MSGATGLKVRLVPCLDVRDGRVVKGTRFESLRDAGDPVASAARYASDGADEIVFLDISATPEGRGAARGVVEATARSIFVPLTVGGGVRSALDAERLLRAGADRVSVNSAAVERPELLDELSRAFGSQCIVLAVDAIRDAESWAVRTEAGRRAWLLSVAPLVLRRKALRTLFVRGQDFLPRFAALRHLEFR